MNNAIKYSIAWEVSVIAWLPFYKIFIASMFGEQISYLQMIPLVLTLGAFDLFYVGVYQHVWDKVVKGKVSKSLSVANAVLYKLIAYFFTVPLAMWFLGIQGTSALGMQVFSTLAVLAYGAAFKYFWGLKVQKYECDSNKGFI